ncbi:acetyl-coenzyme A carboxylase carboxyltransferase subunit alpha [Striga asiatica]|uniref:Acetyl-coenzyme A carboxylase carboxyltransferase subunit alpha n=1 Tax=Striga asiatica TaxID=4170 RepID=A0A5A7PK37_STRAF|nr:acetyl-coenzyme A carboxylase carboxyltransferase subunit alpha [Striga asiatica]
MPPIRPQKLTKAIPSLHTFLSLYSHLKHLLLPDFLEFQHVRLHRHPKTERVANAHGILGGPAHILHLPCNRDRTIHFRDFKHAVVIRAVIVGGGEMGQFGLVTRPGSWARFGLMWPDPYAKGVAFSWLESDNGLPVLSRVLAVKPTTPETWGHDMEVPDITVKGVLRWSKSNSVGLVASKKKSEKNLEDFRGDGIGSPGREGGHKRCRFRIQQRLWSINKTLWIPESTNFVDVSKVIHI